MHAARATVCVSLPSTRRAGVNGLPKLGSCETPAPQQESESDIPHFQIIHSGGAAAGASHLQDGKLLTLYGVAEPNNAGGRSQCLQLYSRVWASQRELL